MQEAEYFNLRLEIQASGRLERGTWSRSLLLFKKVCGLSQLVCFAWETGFWCTCTICLAGVVEDGSEQKCHEERSLVQDSRTWVEVWNGLYGRSPDRSARVCNLCENGDIFKMRNTLFFHVLCHSKSLSLQSIRLSTTIYIGFKPGSSLSRAKAGNCTTDCNSPDNLSLSFSAVSQIRLTWPLTYTIPHTHTSRAAAPLLPRAGKFTQPSGWA